MAEHFELVFEHFEQRPCVLLAQWPDEFVSCAQCHDSSLLVPRLCVLAVLRELQVRKCVDVVTLRNRYRLPTSQLSKAIQAFNKVGALEGHVIGKDPENGYDYKLWTLTDQQSARKAAQNMRCRLMPLEGKANIIP